MRSLEMIRTLLDVGRERSGGSPNGGPSPAPGAAPPDEVPCDSRCKLLYSNALYREVIPTRRRIDAALFLSFGEQRHYPAALYDYGRTRRSACATLPS